jgi:ubiquinone/menaquinone biosynthesis C-methylase UbiE
MDMLVSHVGRVFLRHGRIGFPVVVLAAYSLSVPSEAVLGSEYLEHLLDLSALAVVLVGLTVRALALGVSGQGTSPLSRSSLYLGGFLVCLGIFLMHGALPVILVGSAACALLYIAMARAEKADSAGRLEPRYRAYRNEVKDWLRAGGKAAPADFNVRRALAADWPTIVATAAALALTELHESLPPAIAASSQLAVIAAAASFAIASLVMALRGAGAAAEIGGADIARGIGDAVRRAAPETRGIRVDGRVRSVDRLENCISLGRQEAILRSTLDAAALGPGERLVDIGCGTGKLVVAAAAMLGDRHGGASHVLGIDATPGMIDLALRRARGAGVAAEFQVGVAEALPLDDGAADAVTSSYFFHHLPPDVKPEALREMWRILKPGGRLVITDYARAHGLAGLVASIPMRMNFYEYVRPQLGGELETIIAAQGLGAPEIVRRYLGYITVMRLVKPR